MDTSIKLRNKSTEQECTFADREQAEHFAANVDHASDWETIGAAHVDVEPQGTVVSVDLAELREAVAADTAAEPAPEVKPAKSRNK